MKKVQAEQRGYDLTLESQIGTIGVTAKTNVAQIGLINGCFN